MRNRHSNGNLRKLEADGGEATEVKSFQNGFVDGVILGLDGGATSTVCVCVPFFSNCDPFPEPLPILGRAVAGCTNRNSVGETAARDSLEQVISEALVQSGSDKSDVRGVCLGVSGVNHPSDQEKIENWIRSTALDILFDWRLLSVNVIHIGPQDLLIDHCYNHD